MAERDTLDEERKAFELAQDAESDNRELALADLRFARLGEQWPDKIKEQREREGRPVLTINKMPAFIRQVVNDSRMNRPQIKVKPVDDHADKRTAQVLEGLIRNIEYTSKADVAYDTAVDFAASMGWGYLRVAVDYEYDDTFDKALKIQRVSNPFSVYGDPNGKEADSSDWNKAFVAEYMSKEEFRAKYKGAEEVDWSGAGYEGMNMPWRDEDQILVAESWTRSIVKRMIYKLSDNRVVGADEYEAGKDYFEMMGVTVQAERETNGYKIVQRIMTGAEILSEEQWAGQYIPIIPVYGEELNIEGRRYFRSLIRDAQDAQRMFNYWRSTSTEMVALAPRVPWIGEEGTFDVEPEKWGTANTQSHPYLQYARGKAPPQRLQLDSGPAVGAMSEAMAAGDDMKAIMGMYDASLGQRSNETSGKAIMARQREGDVSTFHFIDNLSRAIRHTGAVLIDMIPKVYTGERIVRVLGEDGKADVAKLGQKPEIDGNPEAVQQDNGGIYDLATGRYDVAVSTGPGFTTKREEAAVQMTEFVRAFPQAAPVIGDILVKAMDWPQADEIAERIKSMMPQQAKGGMPPELAEQIKQGMEQIKTLTAENEAMKQDKAIEMQKVEVDRFNAETNRLKAEAEVGSKWVKVRDVVRGREGLIAQVIDRYEPNPASMATEFPQ